MTNYSLENLLAFDGEEFTTEEGLTMRFKVKRCPVTPERPLGIRYSLTLHDPYGHRILGFDNAHAAGIRKQKRFGAKIRTFDHVHRSARDKGVPIPISDAAELLALFLHEVDQYRQRLSMKGNQ